MRDIVGLVKDAQELLESEIRWAVASATDEQIAALAATFTGDANQKIDVVHVMSLINRVADDKSAISDVTLAKEMAEACYATCQRQFARVVEERNRSEAYAVALEARYKWLAARVLMPDYGDNGRPGEVGWRIPPTIRAMVDPILYGPSIDAAIDAELAKNPLPAATNRLPTLRAFVCSERCQKAAEIVRDSIAQSSLPKSNGQSSEPPIAGTPSELEPNGYARRNAAQEGGRGNGSTPRDELRPGGAECGARPAGDEGSGEAAVAPAPGASPAPGCVHEIGVSKDHPPCKTCGAPATVFDMPFGYFCQRHIPPGYVAPSPRAG